jgi:hypothetical protein
MLLPLANVGVLATTNPVRTSYMARSGFEPDSAKRAPLVAYWGSMNGKQSGDPAKLARALVTIASQSPPPPRFIAGADAIGTAERKIVALEEDIESNPQLSMSLDIDP